VTTRWVIFGGGGHYRAVRDVLARTGDEVAAIVDPLATPEAADTVVSDDCDGVDFALANGLPVLVAIGENRSRLRLLHAALASGLAAPPLIAMTATVALGAVIGEGTVVMEHAHVGPLAAIGRGTIVNTGAIVEHDAVLGDGVHIAPGAVVAGHGRCGPLTLVGAGAILIPSAHVGENSVIGAGGVVLADVPSGVIAVGVPVRLLQPP
jgi:sugar O-acyltransferase (sialic acid O-acetyltransferase NeuD family)